MKDFVITTVIRVAGVISLANCIHSAFIGSFHEGDLLYAIFLFIWISGEYSWWRSKNEKKS